jgi:hypothetical protein
MDKRIEEYWVEKYPNMFKGYHMTPHESPMSWGFACGNGWFELMDQLWKDLSKYNDVIVMQVKEKLSVLTVYIRSEHKAARGLTGTAMRDSSKICEMCGLPGERRSGSWLFTLCDDCHGLEPTDMWAKSEAKGADIVKKLGLRTVCKSEKDHIMNFDYTKCLCCGARFIKGKWCTLP